MGKGGFSLWSWKSFNFFVSNSQFASFFVFANPERDSLFPSPNTCKNSLILHQSQKQPLAKCPPKSTPWRLPVVLVFFQRWCTSLLCIDKMTTMAWRYLLTCWIWEKQLCIIISSFGIKITPADLKKVVNPSPRAARSAPLPQVALARFWTNHRGAAGVERNVRHKTYIRLN